MKRLSTGLLLALVALAPALAEGQVEVVEESESEQVLERGVVRQQGRGVQYGAHLIVPILLTDVRRAMGGVVAPTANPGAGLLVRIGWEFPSGLTAEVQGGFAFHYVDHDRDMLSRTLTRVDIRGALRYNFFNESALVPFVEAGVGARLLWLEFGDGLAEPNPGATVAVHGGAGAQLEVSEYFGIELGLMVDYVFTMSDLFDEPGIIGLTPFVGVTLYAYDQNE